MPFQDGQLTFHGNIERSGDHHEVGREAQEQGLVEPLGCNLGTFPYLQGVRRSDDQQLGTA